MRAVDISSSHDGTSAYPAPLKQGHFWFAVNLQSWHSDNCVPVSSLYDYCGVSLLARSLATSQLLQKSVSDILVKQLCFCFVLFFTPIKFKSGQNVFLNYVLGKSSNRQAMRAHCKQGGFWRVKTGQVPPISSLYCLPKLNK